VLELDIFRLLDDPILGYSLLAALFLAAVSLASGWVRLDFLAVLRPLGLLHVVLAVLVAVLLLVAMQALRSALATSDTEWLRQLASSDYWPAHGLSRLPLYLLALGYGPTAGLLAAGLFAAFGAQGMPHWREAVLGLELMLIGWLAIYPSPFRHRWAGPFNVLVGYALAWLTAGVALLQLERESVTLANFVIQQQPIVVGALLSGLLLFAAGPASYRAFFRLSRITPIPLLRRRDDPVLIGDLRPGHSREREQLLPPPLPELKRARRKARQLEPPRFGDE
jgi:hypothetical protein